MVPNPNDPTTSGPHPVGSNHPPQWVDPDNKRSEEMDDEATRLDEEGNLNEEEKEKKTDPDDFNSFDVDKVDELEKEKNEDAKED